MRRKTDWQKRDISKQLLNLPSELEFKYGKEDRLAIRKIFGHFLAVPFIFCFEIGS